MLIINAPSSDTLSNVLFGLHSLLWAACVPVRADSALVSFCPVALASRPRRGASVWGPREPQSPPGAVVCLEALL